MIEIGKTYVFGYPCAMSALDEYTAHRGKPVTVTRFVPDSELPIPGGEPIYEVQHSDGWIGHAFEDELLDLDQCVQTWM